MGNEIEKLNVAKEGFHPDNPLRFPYDFDGLVKICPELLPFVLVDDQQHKSIDFAHPIAVKTLNMALLRSTYKVFLWDLPDGFLCPPIPSRADYLYQMTDLLKNDNEGRLPKGRKIKVLDIGVGANCIYPLIGHKAFGWSFIGSDVNQVALDHARLLVKSNRLEKSIKLVFQKDAQHIFEGVIQPNDQLAFTMCNPPFHESLEEASKGSSRKWKNLKGEDTEEPNLNFGGQSEELAYPGGELAFISTMIAESVQFKEQCGWFSSLVSKKSNVAPLQELLQAVEAKEVKVLEMGIGQKSSRVIAWRFF